MRRILFSLGLFLGFSELSLPSAPGPAAGTFRAQALVAGDLGGPRASSRFTTGLAPYQPTSAAVMWIDVIMTGGGGGDSAGGTPPPGWRRVSLAGLRMAEFRLPCHRLKRRCRRWWRYRRRRRENHA